MKAVLRSNVGLTINFAPAIITTLAVIASSTVPAPTITSESFENSSFSCLINSSAEGAVNVNSIAFTPPFTQAIAVL